MSDTLEDIRSAIMSRIASGFTAIPVAYPGKDANVDGVNHALQVDLNFEARKRAALGAAAGSRIDGHVVLTVLARQDATAQVGTAALEGYLDDLSDLFPSALNIAAGANTLRFKEPVPGGTQNMEGWVGRQLRCPFYLFT